LFDWAAQPYFTLDHDLRLRAVLRKFRRARPGERAGAVGLCHGCRRACDCAVVTRARRDCRCQRRRKPWIAGFGVLLVIGASAMWIGKPGNPDVIPALLLAYAIASVGVEFATSSTMR